VLLNDLWVFDSQNVAWTRLGGSSAGNAWPSSSWPGGRRGAAVWSLPDGSVFIFGGNGLSGRGIRGDLSDLWKFDIISSGWTLLGSSEGVVEVPVNQPMTQTWPGARRAAQMFIDGVSGDMYMFGGVGFGAVSNSLGNLNDLWRYRVLANKWQLVAGETTINSRGIYGTLGVASSINSPPARSDMAGWTVGSKLFLFGGFGHDGFFNDVWVFDSGVWTWIGGQDGVNRLGSSVVPGSRFGTTAHVNSGGTKVTFFGGYTQQGVLNELWEFDLTLRTFVFVGGSRGVNWTSNQCQRGAASRDVVPGGRTRHASWLVGTDLVVFGGFGLSTTIGPPGYLNDLYMLKLFTTQPLDLCGGAVSVQLSADGQISLTGDSSSTSIIIGVCVAVGAVALLITAAVLTYRFLIKAKKSAKMIVGSPTSPGSPMSPQQLILELKEMRPNGTDHKMIARNNLSPRRALDFESSE
jgi:N-acetylneuraminic acid mutarotase